MLNLAGESMAHFLYQACVTLLFFAPMLSAEPGEAAGIADDPARITALIQAVDTQTALLAPLTSSGCSGAPRPSLLSSSHSAAVPLSGQETHRLLQQYRHPLGSLIVTLTARSLPLGEVAQLLSQQTGLSLSIDTECLPILCTCSFYQRPLREVLRLLLAGLNPRCALMVAGDSLRIGRSEVIAAALNGEAAAREYGDLVTRQYRFRHRILSDSLMRAVSQLWQRIAGSNTQYVCTLCPAEQIVLMRGPQRAIRRCIRVLRCFDKPYPQVLLSVWLVVLDTRLAQKLGAEWFGGGEWRKCRYDLSLGNGVGQAPHEAASWLRVVLHAAERSHRARTLVQPTIMAREGTTAQLWQGMSIPLESTLTKEKQKHVARVKSVQYKDVGIKISVTPKVLRGKRVELALVVENSRVAKQPLMQSTYPALAVSKMEHTVVVQHKSMVMIGGLAQDEREAGEGGLPFFSRLPFFGSLFGVTEAGRSASRLCLFVSPTIVR